MHFFQLSTPLPSFTRLSTKSHLFLEPTSHNFVTSPEPGAAVVT